MNEKGRDPGHAPQVACAYDTQLVLGERLEGGDLAADPGCLRRSPERRDSPAYRSIRPSDCREHEGDESEQAEHGSARCRSGRII